MSQVSGPVIAVGLVLGAVFVPCAFISGITGQFFRQFALTIAVSTLISAFNSLTLSPALSAVLLRPHQSGPQGGRAAQAGVCRHRRLGRLRLARADTGLRRGNFALAAWRGRAARRGLVVSAVLAVSAGAALGWLLTRPLESDPGPGLPRLQRRLPVLHQRLHPRRWAWPCARQRVVLVVYGGLLALTYLGLHAGPLGLHPHAGQGLPAGQRAIARRRLRGADRGRHAPHRRHRPRSQATPRRQPHRGHRRAVDPAGRQRRQLRRHVRDARRFPQAHLRRALRRRNRRPPPEGLSRRRSTTAW